MSMSIKSVNFTPRRASIIYELQNSVAVLKKETSFSKNAVPAQKTAMRSTASFCDIDYLDLVNYNITTTQRFVQYLFNIYQKKINGKTGLQKVGIPKTRGGAPASRAACMRGHTPLIIMVYNIKQKSRLPAVR